MVRKEMIPVPFEKFWERVPGISKDYLVETVDNLLSEQNHKVMKLCAIELTDTLPEKNWREDNPNLLEVVDPYLHCFVSGVTTTELPKQCDFETPCRKKYSEVPNYSERFQLLPTEFFADPNSKKVTTRSYINNLDPRQYENLYHSIEAVVEAALPHFEKVLTDLVKLDTTYKNNSVSLIGVSLQIIVGMKSIYLTPKSPKYLEDSWQIEGLINERIVASAIYDYDVANISESQLAFRVQTDDNKNRTELGYATAKSNQLVVFPNLYEHVVKSFELENKSKSGYRKFITLSLVDPATKIISTANVAPQQISWQPITGIHSSNLLPAEGSKYLTSSTMALEKAKEYRNLATEERGVTVKIIAASLKRRRI